MTTYIYICPVQLPLSVSVQAGGSNLAATTDDMIIMTIMTMVVIIFIIFVYVMKHVFCKK